jgi:tRNA pseudouridine55 synthase
MDGKPLYEYARKGIPLPRPIEKRPVNVISLELSEWKGSEHMFQLPQKALTSDEKKAMEVALSGVEETPSITDQPEDVEAVPTAFTLSMKVSGGTYVRSIVHDLAHAVGSAGHVVTLTRTRQGRFALKPTEDGDFGCINWDVFERAAKDPGDRDENGWAEWERAVMEKLEIIDH